ncbi:MAG TPA: nucleotidyltransferase family protein [Alphaproteobacteria bacterium]
MSEPVGRRAMILAAGLGVRMRPLTDTRPKPLIELAGRPLIDYALDRLAAAGVEEVVVNVHWLPDQIEAWAKARSEPRIVMSDERHQLLDTGGGVARALPVLGNEPFFVLNSDSLWIEGTTPALTRMREAWRGTEMDALLLVSPSAATVGYCGKGDFNLDGEGRLSRREEGRVAPFVFAGCHLAAPHLFAGAPEGPFSMNLLWDRALAKGRLFGIRHDGQWLHVGTPEAIAPAEKALAGVS